MCASSSAVASFSLAALVLSSRRRTSLLRCVSEKRFTASPSTGAGGRGPTHEYYQHRIRRPQMPACRMLEHETTTPLVRSNKGRPGSRTELSRTMSTAVAIRTKRPRQTVKSNRRQAEATPLRTVDGEQAYSQAWARPHRGQQAFGGDRVRAGASLLRQRAHVLQAALDPRFECPLRLEALRVHVGVALHRLLREQHRAHVLHLHHPVVVVAAEADQQPALAGNTHQHVAVEQEAEAAEHLLLGDAALARECLAYPLRQAFVVRHDRISCVV